MDYAKNLFNENSDYDVGLLITALNTTSDGLMIVDTNYNILYKNVAADFLLGGVTDRFDLVEWKKIFTIRDIKTKKELKLHEMPIIRAVNGLKYTDYRVYVTTGQNKQGDYLSCNGTPLIGKNNQIIGGVLTFRNITDSYMAERILAQDRAFYKNILDLIPGCVFVKDGTYNYYFTNQEFDILRKEIKEIDPNLNSQSIKDVEEHDREVIRSLIAKEFEEVLNLPGGEIRYYRTIRFPIYHQASDKVLVCGIAFNITERKKIEDNLASERLRSINASKLAAIGTLAGEIGHEINNPIAIIKSITFLIREMIESNEMTEDLLMKKIDTIDSTLDRISNIIRSLKNLSRKGLNETRKVCPIKEVLADVIPLVELRMKKNGIRFNFNPEDPVLDTTISCFHVQIGEVFMNLLTNAADAVASSERPEVQLDFSVTDKELCIRVRDNGPGVAQEVQQKIFEAFFTTKELGKGTGLGLSISKNIIKAHGGEISIEPSDVGACFLVKLPRNLNS